MLLGELEIVRTGGSVTPVMTKSSTRRPEGLAAAPPLLTTKSSVFTPATKEPVPSGMVRGVKASKPLPANPTLFPLRKTPPLPSSVPTLALMAAVATSLVLAIVKMRRYRYEPGATSEASARGVIQREFSSLATQGGIGALVGA